MNRAKIELMLYAEKVAEIENIRLLIDEIKSDENLIRAVNYIEKVQTSTKNNFNTPMEIIETLEKRKRILQRDIHRIDNALTILTDKERQALTLKYIKMLPQSNVEIFIDRSNKQTKRIIKRALEKINKFF